MKDIREDLELIDIIFVERVIKPKVKKKTKSQLALEEIEKILLDLKDKIINEVKELEDKLNIKMEAKQLIHLIATRVHDVNNDLDVVKETVTKRKLKSGETKVTKKQKYKITEEMVKDLLKN